MSALHFIGQEKENEGRMRTAAGSEVARIKLKLGEWYGTHFEHIPLCDVVRVVQSNQLLQ